MAFAEDFDIFFADFGDDASLAGAPVRVIFAAPGGDALGLSVESPAVQLPTASVPSSYAGALLVISTGQGAGSWLVREHRPDGTGMSTLMLSEA